LDQPHREAKSDAPGPSTRHRVRGQVVVHVTRAPRRGEGVEALGRRGGHPGFAFAGLHFGRFWPSCSTMPPISWHRSKWRMPSTRLPDLRAPPAQRLRQATHQASWRWPGRGFRLSPAFSFGSCSLGHIAARSSAISGCDLLLQQGLMLRTPGAESRFSFAGIGITPAGF